MFLNFLSGTTALLFLVFIQSSCTSSITRNHRSISSSSVAGDAAESAKENLSQILDSETSSDRSEVMFDWPVDRARLTRGFDVAKRRPHLGIDLAGPRRTPVFASHNGMVIYAGRDFRGFGKMILVETGNGWATLYAHLDAILVSEGQKVNRGSTIALLGNTGRSTGPHLHFELRRGKAPVDPLMYLPGGMEAQRELASKR